ncbi:MAG: metallophosphoesterase [Tessaracoccus sp.]|uniref:metallophosphoesterase n=1 Tax=Tessaracoccus sp. TaxID=1971211 RepID=UPI001ECFE3DD|nr:metallophosphoesterase [Tessaracoccus sp.]MBK7822540.1 metallophosphoesterase [Tessaracoccus sp.]
MSKALVKAAAATVAVGGACFAWGLAEAGLYTVRRFDLDILPPGGRSLRILHVSDLHLRAAQERKLAFVRSLAVLEPDVVVNTGDNITEPGAIAPLLAAMDGLRSLPGVFVFGSNDYFAPRSGNPLKYLLRRRSSTTYNTNGRQELPWEQLRDGLEGCGWDDLTHRRATLEVNGYRLAFRGTDDAHLSRDDYSLVAGPADATADLNIGVTHAPYLRVIDAMAADGMDLILAGHTHGGQVCVPFYGALVTNCDLDAARVKGMSSHTAGGHTAHMHVSAGLGTSPYAPYRFACRPEVTLLTLRPRPS